jgi:hypothetical protein
MLNIILFIIIWIVFFVLGMKVGIGFVLDSLAKDRKLSVEEYAHFSSWKFIKKSLLNQ